MSRSEARCGVVFAMSVLLAGASGCGAGARPFRLRDPLTVDKDDTPFYVACKPDPKKPDHSICAPHEYVSPFVLDGLDNMMLRPITRFFAVDPAGESENVNALDEVPDSSWFTNRIAQRRMTIPEMVRGPCDAKPLDVDAPDGEWLIDQGKANGANPGFRVTVPGRGRFLLKADEEKHPERATGATAIATRLYHAAGYFTGCDTVIYIRPSLLRLKEGLTFTDNTGVMRAFDQARLDKMLEAATRRGDRIRLVASQWLPGRPLGPFKYSGTRKDDPNDIIDHQDRRELRGQRLLAAWLGHFDSREQNSMDTWMSENGDDPDASPGHIRHWIIDFNDCFGSEWQWEGLTKRINFSYYFDGGEIARDFVTLGLIERPWDNVKRSPDGEIFGYFESEQFEPEDWKPGYQNPAFLRMTERDGAWMARILSRITPDHVKALVAVGDYTEPRHRDYLTRVLIERRRKILERYLTRLSSLADFSTQGSRLCATDLALKASLRPREQFGYGARVRGVEDGQGPPLPIQFEPDDRICVDVPQLPASGADGDPSRYRIVTLWNGVSKRPLRAHLYDLGPQRGLRLVGIER